MPGWETNTGEAARLFDREHRAVSIGTLLAMSLIAFEGLALVTIAPEIANDLEGFGLYGWIFSAFLLAQVVGTVGAGQFADKAGPAQPLLISLVLFGIGLILAALAPTMVLLVIARALQGLGGGVLATCVYTITNTAYPDSLRPRMLAAISSAFILPALLGPALAGFVAEALGWRVVFYGLLPLLAAVWLLATPAFRRVSREKQSAEADVEEKRAREPSRLPAALALATGAALLLGGLELQSVCTWGNGKPFRVYFDLAGAPAALAGRNPLGKEWASGNDLHQGSLCRWLLLHRDLSRAVARRTRRLSGIHGGSRRLGRSPELDNRDMDRGAPRHQRRHRSKPAAACDGRSVDNGSWYHGDCLPGNPRRCAKPDLLARRLGRDGIRDRTRPPNERRSRFLPLARRQRGIRLFLYFVGRPVHPRNRDWRRWRAGGVRESFNRRAPVWPRDGIWFSRYSDLLRCNPIFPIAAKLRDMASAPAREKPQVCSPVSEIAQGYSSYRKASAG